jgi:hypothetical protein
VAEGIDADAADPVELPGSVGESHAGAATHARSDRGKQQRAPAHATDGGDRAGVSALAERAFVVSRTASTRPPPPRAQTARRRANREAWFGGAA